MDALSDSAARWMFVLTSTILPILCLQDWNSPKCRLAGPPPRFAAAFDASRLTPPTKATRFPVKSTLAPRRPVLRASPTPSKSPWTAKQPLADPRVTKRPRIRGNEETGTTLSAAINANGFFTPVLFSTSGSAAPRNSGAVSKPHPPRPTPLLVTSSISSGESSSTTTTPPHFAESTTSTGAPPTSVRVAPTRSQKQPEEGATSRPKMRTTTTTSVVYLEEIAGSDEGSAEIPLLEENGKPVNLPVRPALQQTPATTVTTHAPTSPTLVTVIPRPYESVEEAMRQNPEYASDLAQQTIGDESRSIWSAAEVVPEEQKYVRPTSSATRKPVTSATAASTTTAVATTRRRIVTTPATNMLAATSTGYLAISSKSTVPNVRPTTPMTSYVPSTSLIMKDTPPQDFPRTALISIASVSVILVIAVVVFCVFRCRQSPPPGDHYPMVCNGKSQGGYTPIAGELSPPMPPAHHHGDPATQPLIVPARVPQVNGYQPLKGTNMPSNNNNGNGILHRSVDSTVIGGNGGGASAKKKDFKEWYV